MNAMVALDRCRRAWERTSPQLVIDGWLDMLDELDTSEVKRAESVPSAAASLVSSPPTPLSDSTPTPIGGLDSTSLAPSAALRKSRADGAKKGI